MLSKKIENGMLILYDGEKTSQTPTQYTGFKHESSGMVRTEVYAPNEKILSMWKEFSMNPINEETNVEEEKIAEVATAEEAVELPAEEVTTQEVVTDELSASANDEKQEKKKKQTKQKSEEAQNKKPDRVLVGIMAILFGSYGVHRFMLKQTKLGLLYLLFCWTGIPFVLGLIDGIRYLSSSDEAFEEMVKKESELANKKLCDILPVCKLEQLPYLLALLSVLFTLLSNFWIMTGWVFAFAIGSMAISYLCILASLGLETYQFVRSGKLVLKLEMLLQALAVLALLI